MRVYVPSTMTGLRRLHEDGGLRRPPTPGSAVTEYLRTYYSVAGDEELEYLVLTAAAHDSLRLVAAEPGAARRRVVVVLDVADAVVAADSAAGPTAVRVSADVPLAGVVAVHVDGDEAVAAIEAAAAAAAAADTGDATAEGVVAAAEEHELLWYAVQEIGDLLVNLPTARPTGGA